MTLPIERARTRRPVTWLTVIGVLLLPAILGGILVTALYNPTERLESLTAAIVNNDEPVTINDQYTPLGRQLTAGLVEGSDDLDSNLTWVVSNADDAATGLADGTYQAVITIPENFSAAATSSGQALSGSDAAPEQALIEVSTPPDALIVDDAITAQVTQTAASVMGQSLSTLTLENVFVGFTTIGDQLGTAADGATELATGAHAAADGAAAIPSGATQLADGAGALSTGATALAEGLGTIGTNLHSAADGTTALVAGLGTFADTLVAQGIVPADLTGLASGAATGAAANAQTLGGLAAQCAASGADAAFCATLTTAASDAASVATQNAYVSGGLGQLATQAPQQIAGQLRGIQTQGQPLASGLQQLADGVDQSTGGATALATGATELQTGASTLGEGATELATGVGSLATGADALATGLAQASTALPSYSDSEAQSLADVVSNPVGTTGVGSSLFGASAIPLLSMLALWFGGLATYIAMGAATRRALVSRRSSGVLALRTFLPGALIGAGQGLLVAVVVQIAASYEWPQWWAFAGISVLAGVAFAAVNQALVALVGGVGRWIAALAGVLALATGIVSTAPGALAALAGLLPTSPAYTAMLGALSDSGGIGAGIAALVIWTALSLIATTLAVARRRTTSARALLAVAAPA